jgi:hypothetical protein
MQTGMSVTELKTIRMFFFEKNGTGKLWEEHLKVYI